MNENKPELEGKKPADPLPVDPEERWDWDADLSPFPPPLRRWKVRARIRYKKAEPMPYPDPEDDLMAEKNALEQAERPKTIQPTTACEGDIEKDDVVVSPPPPRRSGVIKVRLRYVGRSKPIPVDYPSDE
jgi:hypothetical protein